MQRASLISHPNKQWCRPRGSDLVTLPHLNSPYLLLLPAASPLLFSFSTTSPLLSHPRLCPPVPCKDSTSTSSLSLPRVPYPPLAAMAANAIPLHCNICPKKPKFSDVSHLLTHISSKGHLSNYYRVKVRSSTEDESRLLIEAYDRWYAEWNVEELMAERMSQKDKRRTRARPGCTIAPPVCTGL